MDEEAIMLKAIEKAHEGIKEGQTPFGACIAKDGKIVSCAHNTVWKSCDITAHAEINAIREACKKLLSVRLSGCKLYSTCEPCPMCFSAAHWARLDEIIYGATIADAKKAGFHELEVSDIALRRIGKSRVKLRPGFMAKECKALFREWKALGGRAY